MGTIRGPSIEMMIKMLGIKKHQAKTLKDYMRTGDVDRTLDLANTVLEGFGVEAMRDESIWAGNYYGSIGMLYVNLGDSYVPTLCYDTRKRQFIACCWADWAEKNLRF